MRRLVFICTAALWLLGFAAAILIIIPLSGMGLAAIFDASMSGAGRLQGLGFLALGLISVAALLLALTRISRLIGKAFHA